MISTISVVFVGITLTSFLRVYLKKHVGINNFGKSKILKLIISTIITISLFGTFSFIFNYLYGKYIIYTAAEIEYFERLSGFWVSISEASITIVGWVFLYYTIKIILRSNKDRIERLELDATLKEAQLNTLKGQINPHFMFNSLNNIRGLMLEDVEKSRDMLTKLSEMLQYALTKNTVDSIAVEDELEMVDNYIELAKIQMEDRLAFEKNVAPETLNIKIPPMIIQLLVENAAKHGISNLKEGGKISLAIFRVDDTLNIQVKNTGKLQIDKDSTRLGLKNIQQRLRLLYENKASFSLKEVNNEVIANIKIPLI